MQSPCFVPDAFLHKVIMLYQSEKRMNRGLMNGWKGVRLDPVPLSLHAPLVLVSHNLLEGSGGNVEIVVGTAIAATGKGILVSMF